MHTHIIKKGAMSLLVLAFCLFQAGIMPAFSISAPLPQQCTDSNSELTVTPTSSSSAQLDWEHWGGQGAYTVRVKLSESGTVLSQFNTNNNTTSINGLVKGEGYRFEVEKNGFVVPVEVEVYW